MRYNYRLFAITGLAGVLIIMSALISPLIPVSAIVLVLILMIIKDYRIGTFLIIIFAFTNIGGQQIFKSFHIFILIISLTIISLSLAVLRGNVSLKGARIFNLLLAILGSWALLSGILATNIKLWLYMLEYMIRAIIVFYLVYNSFSSEEELYTLFKVVVCGIVLSSLIPLVIGVGSLSLSAKTLIALFTSRFAGTIDDPNFYAMTIAGIIPLVFVLIIKERNIMLKIFWVFCVFFLMLTIIFSQSRTGFVAIFAVFMYTMLHMIRKKRKEVLIFVLPVILLLVIIPPAFWYRMAVLIGSLSSGTRGDTSMVHRLHLVYSAFDVFIKNPLFGVGLGNFEAIASRYTIYPMVCHNTYLEIASNLGLLGFIPYLSILYKGLTTGRKGIKNGNASELIWAVRASLLGMYIAIMFLSVPFKLDLWIMLGVAAIIDNKIVQ